MPEGKDRMDAEVAVSKNVITLAGVLRKLFVQHGRTVERDAIRTEWLRIRPHDAKSMMIKHRPGPVRGALPPKSAGTWARHVIHNALVTLERAGAVRRVDETRVMLVDAVVLKYLSELPAPAPSALPGGSGR